MTKLPLILSVVFVLVFIAGGATGLSFSRTKAPPHHRGPYLAGELGLTAEQNAEMKQIWQDAMGQAREAHRQRYKQLCDERDVAIADMLTPDQTIRFEQIKEEYEKGIDELAGIRQQAIDQAVVKTKAMLSAEQAELYEKLRPKDMGRRGRGWDRRGDRHYKDRDAKDNDPLKQ